MLSNYYHKRYNNNLDLNNDYGYFCDPENEEYHLTDNEQPIAKKKKKPVYNINVDYYILKPPSPVIDTHSSVHILIEQAHTTIVNNIFYIFDIIYTGSFKKLYRRLSGL